MDKKKLIALIKKEEGMKLDFKQRIDLETESGRKELAKDICALANSRGGRGYLIIGVEDKTKKIVGVEKGILIEEQIQQIVSARCEPPIPISLHLVPVDGKQVGVITIYDGEQKPYQLRENGAFYIRRGSTTDTMRKQEIISAFHESLSLNIELCPIIKSDINCINTSFVDKYFLSQGITVTKENRMSLMENVSIITLERESGEYVATLGGILVFSENNHLYLPHNMIKIINKINKDISEVTIIQGTILTMLDKVENLLQKIFPSSYPVDAIYEGVKNAALYRDYTIFNREIDIVIDYHSVSVISPGSLLKSETKVDVNTYNYYKRNMWIYEKLIQLDDKKRFLQSGKGFSRMKNAFKNHGKVLFINSFLTDSFKIIYPGINNFK